MLHTSDLAVSSFLSNTSGALLVDFSFSNRFGVLTKIFRSVILSKAPLSMRILEIFKFLDKKGNVNEKITKLTYFLDKNNLSFPIPYP